MIKTLPLLLGFLALGCAASTPSPASPSPTSTSPTALIAAEPLPPAPARRLGDFPPVADRGLVTVQEMSLIGPSTSTIRVGADGAWSWASAAGTKTGNLDATQLAAVRVLLDEAALAKRSTEPGLPCDAITTDAARVLFGKDREMGWSGPCAGPPPPDVFIVLQRYLRQAAEGKPASELEKTLQMRRRR